MSNQHIAEVARFYREKTASGFTGPITYLGAYQQFVGALRNSNVNNLEEQYIIGTDTYTEKYTLPNGNLKIDKDFHVANSNNGYYRLETTIYNESEEKTNEEYYFQDLNLFLPNSFIFDDEYFTLEGSDEVLKVNEDSTILSIYPSSLTILKVEELYFVKNNNTKEHILTKQTGRKYTQEGREIIQETVINHLL